MKIFHTLILLVPLTIFSQVVLNDPLAHWHLNGDALDESENNFNGTLTSATPTLDRFETENHAFHFDGSGYIDFGDVLDVGLSDFSIHSWFKLESSSNYRTIISKAESSALNGRYAIYIDPQDYVFVVFDYGPNLALKSTTAIENDVWYHVAVTFDRDGDGVLYINGIEEHRKDMSGSANYNMATTFPLRIGEYSGDGNFFNGTIDEIAIYDAVLSQNQIQSIVDYVPPIELCTNIYCDGSSLGIGVEDTKGYKLAVAGKTITEEVKVALIENWPDYVFGDSHELRTLNEVENFIAKNKHLPEIPSETEVTENGINLGEMDSKLLKKIEELTLYMIEINKRVNQLETENTELKEKVQSLENE